MGGSDRRRIARLIDELVDHAHRECPGRAFRLQLPSGEAVLVLPHDPMTRCHSLGHLGYFTTLVEPFLTVSPVPSRRRTTDLRCWLIPVVPEPAVVAELSDPGPPDHDRSVAKCSSSYSVDLAPPGGRRLPGPLRLRPSDPRG